MVNTGKEIKTEAQTNNAQITGTPDKLIPKLCSAINFGVTTNNLVIISLAYGEDPNMPSTLIERVAIDLEHAKKVVEVLNDVLVRAEKR